MTERRLYFVVIALCLAAVVVIGVAVRQEQSRSWRWYQAEFVRRTEADMPARLAVATDDRLRADLRAAAGRVAAQGVALRQLYVPELGQVSRCVSCHVATTEPLMARTQFPWKRHPEPYLEAHWHPFEQYGCVVCHGGNGRATETVAAHGEEGVGVMPRRKDEFAQAACGRCHRAAEIDGAPAWNRGRYLVEDRGCAGCHDFQNAIPAERIGPTLDGLGSKTSESWLTAWLVKPEVFRPQPRMPRPRLDAREAAAIARVLAARRSPQVEAVATSLAAARTDASRFERRGREWVEGAAGCTTCHDWPRLKRRGFHPVSGWRMIGPDLGRSGEKLNVPYVAALLSDPQSIMPGTVMPQYTCAEADRLGAAAYVVGLGVSQQRSGRTVELPPAEPSQEDKALASAAMIRLGCSACHDGAPSTQARIGPALADVADRRYWQLQWSAAAVPPEQRHLQRYLEWKLEGSPQVEGAEASRSVRMRMPEYRLSQHERRSVVAYLLSRSQMPMPEKFIVEAPSAAFWPQDGSFADVNRTRRCTSCHRLGGQGGGSGPGRRRRQVLVRRVASVSGGTVADRCGRAGAHATTRPDAAGAQHGNVLPGGNGSRSRRARSRRGCRGIDRQGGGARRVPVPRRSGRSGRPRSRLHRLPPHGGHPRRVGRAEARRTTVTAHDGVDLYEASGRRTDGCRLTHARARARSRRRTRSGGLHRGGGSRRPGRCCQCPGKRRRI